MNNRQVFDNIRGVTVPEYTLICAIIALGSIASIGFFGGAADHNFRTVGYTIYKGAPITQNDDLPCIGEECS